MGSPMSLTMLLAPVAAIAALWAVRRVTTPGCPRCGARDWDRKLCAPLLLCRRCASRVDRQYRLCN
jgi:hypothetical protein